MSLESVLTPDTRAVQRGFQHSWQGLGFAYHQLLTAATVLANAPGARENGEAPGLLSAVLCLLAEARDQGHLCLPLSRLPEAWAAHPGADQHPLPGLADPAALARILAASGLVQSAASPLVLDAAGGEDCLYFRGMHQAESAVADLLARHLATPAQAAPAELHRFMDGWFDALPAGLVPHPVQARAVHAAMDHRLFILSGGPGTGKTTTVFHILHALWRRHDGPEPLRLALAAPTGRAAARIQESLAGSLERCLPWLDDMAGRAFAAALAAGKGQTLHRLLGLSGVFSPYEPDAAPLPFDVLVVDEASMVDIHQMAILLGRLAPRTRLLLVGDRDQLPSVGAGSILAELVADPSGPGPLASVHLTHCFRSDTAILDCAAAVLAGRVPEPAPGGALRLLEIPSGRPPAAQRTALVGEWAAQSGLTALARACAEPAASSLPELFEAAARSILLSPLRDGPFGVAALNQQAAVLIREALPRSGPPSGSQEWLPGMMVMATRNDYERGLFNGDRGLVCRVGGRLLAWFPGGRGFSPQTIPGLEPAWAITVHKSQGSEFGTVWLFLGESSRPEGTVSRELLYTGLTRARSRLVLAADRSALASACATVVDRHSLLRERFRTSGR
jgi:exodeoxyribonuclease V alpha subunit